MNPAHDPLRWFIVAMSAVLAGTYMSIVVMFWTRHRERARRAYAVRMGLSGILVVISIAAGTLARYRQDYTIGTWLFAVALIASWWAIYPMARHVKRGDLK